MSKKLTIAILNTTSLDIRTKLSEAELIEFSKDDLTITRSNNIDAFVLDFDSNKQAVGIDTQNHDQFIQLLRRIRANVYTYLKPVFCTNSNYQDYSSEFFTNINDLATFTNMVNDEIASIERITQNIDNMAHDWQARFLVYLYTRRNLRDLKPIKNKSQKSFFSYPLIDIFSQDENFDYYEWIKELKDRDILKFKKFVKSFFRCSNCSSAHALFSERCPECKSEDIILADFLHCYTCGNIAPETEFITGDDELVCSQCKSKLKHIGHDYDRPLESYSCRSCESIFIEPEVITECIDCGTITLTDKMKKQKVSEYTLTDKAKHYVRMNLLEYAMSIFDDINYIAPEFFYSLIDWAYSMQNRDKAYEFSLVQISIFDYLSMADIRVLSKALRDVLRKTDMLTRISRHDIWLWLPNTQLQGANIVIKKLKQINTTESSSIESAVKMTAYHSKALDDFTTAQKFLKKISYKR